MKYCKVIGLNGSFNYNSEVLTIGTFYTIIEKSTLPNRYKIINNNGNEWWVGERVETEDEPRLTWKDMVVFLEELPCRQIGVVSV